MPGPQIPFSSFHIAVGMGVIQGEIPSACPVVESVAQTVGTDEIAAYLAGQRIVVVQICPICKESTKIEIKEYKINLYGCKNGHSKKIYY